MFRRRGFSRRNPFVVWLLCQITLGFYVPIWIARVGDGIRANGGGDVDLKWIAQFFFANMVLANVLLFGFVISDENEDFAVLRLISALVHLFLVKYMPQRTRRALQVLTDTLPVGRGAFRVPHTYVLGVAYLQWRIFSGASTGTCKRDH